MGTPDQDSPTTWDSAYQGMQGATSGVLGMLEVIQSDFARLEAETTSSEDEATRRHRTFLDDSAEGKAVKETEMNHKSDKRESTARVLREKKQDFTATQAELQSALAYFEKLRPACIDTGVSYEERASKREEEIQSLREALRMLEGSDLSTN